MHIVFKDIGRRTCSSGKDYAIVTLCWSKTGVFGPENQRETAMIKKCQKTVVMWRAARVFTATRSHRISLFGFGPGAWHMT